MNKYEYSLRFKLIYNVVFVDKSIRQSLRGNHTISNPIRMQACDSWVYTVLPIFMFAAAASAEATVKLSFFGKRNGFHR
jgi:hypothetical protein